MHRFELSTPPAPTPTPTSIGVSSWGAIFMDYGDGVIEPNGYYQDLNLACPDSSLLISGNDATNVITFTVNEAALSLNDIGGTLEISKGGTGNTSFSAGSIPFSNGSILTQDNSNLFFNDIDNAVGIGNNSPNSPLDISIGSTPVGPTAGPTYLNSVENATPVNYYQNDVIDYRIYSVYTVGNYKYYSNSYVDAAQLTIIAAYGSVDLDWDAGAGTPTSYLILRSLNGSGFTTWYDTGNTSLLIYDDNDGGGSFFWTTGNVPDVSVTSRGQTFGTKFSYISAGVTYSIWGPGSGYIEGNFGVGVSAPAAKLDIYAGGGVGLKLNKIADDSTSTFTIQGFNNGGYGTYSQLVVKDWNGNNVLLFGDAQARAGNAGVLNFRGLSANSGDFRGEMTFMGPGGGDTRVSTWRVFQDGAAATDSGMYFLLRKGGSFIYSLYSTSNQQVGLAGISAPTARLHIAAGSATASQGQLKLAQGTLLTTAETGVLCNTSTGLWFDESSTRRHLIAMDDNPIAHQSFS